MSSPGVGGRKRSWQEIAEEAGREKDSKKLIELIEELNRALDGRDRKQPNNAA